MKKIVLDTNFLLAIGQFHIDIFSELERICDFPYNIYVLNKTIDELNKIKNDSRKKVDRESAKLALQLMEGRVEILEEEGEYVDDILVRISDKDTIIATQDKELKKRLKGRLITIKQKKYLDFNN
ncbi:MAG: twitching motility protein PilT [Nanoarchaeota archaeon]|nr:twitching motility protein PilT [Nanoarchaeota archaeon]MCG2717366.1 twitching motility protein PilT [Nanoarchaeota archaeon]